MIIFFGKLALMKTLTSYIHRRTSRGGHSGNKAGQKFGIDMSIRKFMLRKLAFALEYLGTNKNLIDKL